MPYTEFIFKISFESHTKFVLRKWVSAVYYHACRHFRAYLILSIAINYLVYKYLQYGILERYARAIVIPSGLTGFFVPTLSLSIFALFCLSSSSVYLSYFNLIIPLNFETDCREWLTWLDMTKWQDRTSFFRVRCTSFHIYSSLPTLFLCSIVLCRSCSSYAQVFERTLLHEFSIFYISIQNGTCSLRSTITAKTFWTWSAIK